MAKVREISARGRQWLAYGVAGLVFAACGSDRRDFSGGNAGGGSTSASAGEAGANDSETGGSQSTNSAAGATGEPDAKSNGRACTADSECASGQCRDEVCCAADCSGTCEACAESLTGKPNGTCASVVSGLDPHDDCEAESAESCGRDGTCDGQGACRSGCDLLKAQGDTCNSDAECDSKSCRDGVCCESSCSLSCQACSAATTGLADGTCAARKSSATKPCLSGNTTTCVDLTSDVDHCGRCGDACEGSSLPGTAPVCSASTCSVSCPAGTLGDGVNVCIPVTTVAAGPDFACGLSTDGHVKCWGNPDHGLSPAGLANVLFKSITAGKDFMCGIRDNGLAYCWGNNAPSAKSGTFYSLAAGDQHVCGIKSNRSLDCWTRGSDGTGSPPTGTYRWVASGTDYSCAIVQGGSFNDRGTCWGVGSTTFNNFPSTSSTQTYAQMHGGGIGGWGVRADGSIVSWGKTLFSAPDGTLVKTLGAGPSQDRCGILPDNTLTCWGTPGSQTTIPPSGKFTAIAIGGGFACGVKSGGALTCWGENGQGQAPASVAGTFEGYW